RFSADVSSETLARTTLGALAPGDPLNLEPALRIGDPLDGHLVSGHVDGVGRVVSVATAARSLAISIELPPELERYVARKGSIAVDGVSLTVNAVSGNAFDVNIVPHTRDATIIGRYRVGTGVNIEVDMLARYVARMREGRAATSSRPRLPAEAKRVGPFRGRLSVSTIRAIHDDTRLRAAFALRQRRGHHRRRAS